MHINATHCSFRETTQILGAPGIGDTDEYLQMFPRFGWPGSVLVLWLRWLCERQLLFGR